MGGRGWVQCVRIPLRLVKTTNYLLKSGGIIVLIWVVAILFCEVYRGSGWMDCLEPLDIF